MATTNLNDIEKTLDDLDPGSVTARDAVHFRRVIAAKGGVARADRELHEEVSAAREAGDSWSTIGLALGVTNRLHRGASRSDIKVKRWRPTQNPAAVGSDSLVADSHASR